MNKLYMSIICCAAILISSCTKTENTVFEKSPDERVAEILEKYETILTSAEYGWILSLDAQSSGGYNHWVKFLPDNRIEMLSDADASNSNFAGSSTEIINSTYRLKSVQTPILMFDTYSYMHLLSDPDPVINGGVGGTGLKSDFEFAFGEYDSSAKQIALTGRYHGSQAVLTPCTQAEYQAIIEGGLKTNQTSFNSFIKSNYKFPVLDIDGKKVDVTLSSRQVSIKYINDEDVIESSSVSSYIDGASLSGSQPVSNLNLFAPISYQGSEFDKFSYVNGKFVTTINGKEIEVKENNRPALPLRFGYKKDFSQMMVNVDQLEGTLVDPFLTNIYMLSKNKMNANKRTMQYASIIFENNTTSGKPQMKLTVRYNNTAGTNYSAIWIYQFTENPDGTLTFYDRDQSGSNAIAREPEVRALVDFFCKFTYSSYSTSSSKVWTEQKKNVTKVEPRTMKLDWVDNNTMGLSASIGGFIPVDSAQLESDGICCGVLSK